MINLREIPFFIWISFMLIYHAVGDPDNAIWCGLFFCIDYMLVIWLFSFVRSKKIKIAGLSLGYSLLCFSAIKFFIYPEIEKICIFILFIINVCVNLYLLKRK